jgi:hypothetical protein
MGSSGQGFGIGFCYYFFVAVFDFTRLTLAAFKVGELAATLAGLFLT